MPTGKLLVGIIGDGMYATGEHIPKLRKTGRVEVAAISRRNAEHRVRIQETLQVDRAFTDWQQMLDQGDRMPSDFTHPPAEYCRASARWCTTLSSPARSAMVRPNLRMRWYARALRFICCMAAHEVAPASSMSQNCCTSASHVAVDHHARLAPLAETRSSPCAPSPHGRRWRWAARRPRTTPACETAGAPSLREGQLRVRSFRKANTRPRNRTNLSSEPHRGTNVLAQPLNFRRR